MLLRVDSSSQFRPKEQTMQEIATQERRSHRFNEADWDEQLEQTLNSLKSENSKLKTLVVRLSETIIRNITAKR